MPTLGERGWQYFILAAGLPVIVSASRLDLDLWHDEIYTLLAFVSAGVGQIVTDYSVPNNHILYSLYLRPWYLLSDNQYVLRLSALLITVLCLWCVFRLGRRLAGTATGAFAAMCLGLNQMFIVHTMQLRGYGLSMLLAAWLADVAIAHAPSSLWRRRATIVALGAALVYVMPTNILFFVPLGIASVCWAAKNEGRGTTGEGRGVRGEGRGGSIGNGGLRPSVRSVVGECANWIAAGAVAFVLYLPIMHDVIRHGKHASPASIAGTVETFAHVARSAGRDQWPICVVGLLVLIIARRRFHGRFSATAAVPILAGTVTVGAFALAALLGTVPFERNFCPLLPFWALALGWMIDLALRLLFEVAEFARIQGVAPRAESWRNRLRDWFVAGYPSLRAAIAGLVLVAVVCLPRIASYPRRLADVRDHQFAQDGYFNYYAADYRPSEVARYLAKTVSRARPYSICYAKSDHFNLWYYLRMFDIELRGHAGPTSDRDEVIYLIAPALVDYDSIRETCGLNKRQVQALPLVKDFGYYRLFRGTRPLRLEVPQAAPHDH